MSRQEVKKVTAEISKDCWKALKMLALQKEISLQTAIAEVLEKSMSKKIKQIEVVNEET